MGEDKEAVSPDMRGEEEDRRERKGVFFFCKAVKRKDVQNIGRADVRPDGGLHQGKKSNIK